MRQGTLRRSLNEVALRQAGYFTARQALRVGNSYQAQKHHVDHANWFRVDRGLFRIPGWPPREEDVYVRWWLRSGERAVVSHESALVLHDLSDANPIRLHLALPPDQRIRDPALAVHHAQLTAEDVEERDGFPLTTVERTLLDVAVGNLTQDQLDVALAEALERGLVSPRRLRSRSDAFGDRAALRLERAIGASGR